MLDRTRVLAILESAVWAPSGDNSQPWEFKIEDEAVSVFNLPEKDNVFYNFQQKGSLVAHGALLENIKIAAPAWGYEADLDLLPANQPENLVAKVRLTPVQPRPHYLLDSLRARSTNRKLYKNQALSAEQRTVIENCAAGYQSRLKLAEDEKIMAALGQAVSLNEVIALETKDLHRAFFNELVWTKDEERRKKSGLFVKTMELPPPMEKVFSLFRYWPVINFLNKLGFARLAAKGNARVYSSGAALGLVVAPRNNPRDFLEAGRLMQRVWLEATRLGLSFHPVTGVLFLMQRTLSAQEIPWLRAKHFRMLSGAYQTIKELFGVGQEFPAVLFRLGYADPPSARCSRLPPRLLD